MNTWLRVTGEPGILWIPINFPAEMVLDAHIRHTPSNLMMEYLSTAMLRVAAATEVTRPTERFLEVADSKAIRAGRASIND